MKTDIEVGDLVVVMEGGCEICRESEYFLPADPEENGMIDTVTRLMPDPNSDAILIKLKSMPEVSWCSCSIRKIPKPKVEKRVEEFA